MLVRLNEWNIILLVKRNEATARAHLIDSHEFLCSILLVFSKRSEFNVSRWSCLISEGSFESVQIMSADCNELSPPAYVLMQFIL